MTVEFDDLLRQYTVRNIDGVSYKNTEFRKEQRFNNYRVEEGLSGQSVWKDSERVGYIARLEDGYYVTYDRPKTEEELYFGPFGDKADAVNSLLGEQVKVKAKNPGILEVPDGKDIENLDVSHFKKIADKKSHAAVSKALVNLVRWNKKQNPKLSKWASAMLDKLRKALGKEENVIDVGTELLEGLEESMSRKNQLAEENYPNKNMDLFAPNTEAENDAQDTGNSDAFYQRVMAKKPKMTTERPAGATWDYNPVPVRADQNHGPVDLGRRHADTEVSPTKSGAPVMTYPEAKSSAANPTLKADTGTSPTAAGVGITVRAEDLDQLSTELGEIAERVLDLRKKLVG